LAAKEGGAILRRHTCLKGKKNFQSKKENARRRGKKSAGGPAFGKWTVGPEKGLEEDESEGKVQGGKKQKKKGRIDVRTRVAINLSVIPGVGQPR